MNSVPPPSSSSASVPSIHIHNADDSALFNSGEFDMNIFLDDTIYICPPVFQSDYPSAFVPPPELEDITELSHLSTTPLFITGPSISLPYSTILQDNTFTDPGLSPSTLGSPIPSPTPSFGSSLSPSSFYDPLALSDSESLLSPVPNTPDGPMLWPHLSSESLVPCFTPNDSYPGPSQASTGPHRVRAKSSPPRHGPVASKAMLEANGRRRRHPPQFACSECNQTFTALFSLKRHLQSHTGERPFACSIPGCSQRFYNSSDCKRHEKSKKRHKDLL